MHTTSEVMLPSVLWIWSCRSCKKSPLFRVCIPGGESKVSTSWHPYAPNCSMIWWSSLSLVRCTISSTDSKTEQDVNSPPSSTPPDLREVSSQCPDRANANQGDFLTHWVTVWAEHTSWNVTKPPTSELSQPVPIKLLSDHDHFLLAFFLIFYLLKSQF